MFVIECCIEDAGRYPARPGGGFMARAIKRLLRKILTRFDLQLVKRSQWRRLVEGETLASKVQLIADAPPEAQARLLDLVFGSKSQIGQDLFVLMQTGFKRDGYFVEFGATDGVELSNTWLLEREFGWTGILAEPARAWQAALKKNRTASIETRCVWKETGARLTFSEADATGLSTISTFGESDGHADERRNSVQYEVETVSLNDLLDEHGAPDEIDYLSIDTEGSEFDILNSFDFSPRRFAVITCEHNFSAAREKIFALLTANGYERRFDHLSQFDDWYVRAR